MCHQILFIFILFSCLPSSTFGAAKGLTAMVKEGWTKFWSISCYFSTPSAVLSRSKRSTPGWSLDVHDENQVFDFLYPSADVKVEDYYDYLETGESSKSAQAFQSRSLLSWMDSLVDVWQTQCRLQRQGHLFQNSGKKQEQVPRAHCCQSPDHQPHEKLGEVTNHQNLTATTIVSKEGVKLLPQPSNPSNLSLKVENNWFASYGGDIEYFFPLIGFGIPFDGEITLLGFHGFKGVFPYK